MIVFKVAKRFSGTVYHGSGAKFDQFDQKKSRIPNDFYGGGVAYCIPTIRRSNF
jgi:hypothetical protein